MVDVGHKPVTVRRAVASAVVVLERQTLEQVWSGGLEKGDALAVARVAGIQGAKQTAALIPLCHPLPLDQVAIELRLLPERSAIRVFSEARTRAATGVEMEALTGAAVAGLALIDMVKGIDRNAHLAEIRLEIKEGGSSGRWVREGYEDPFSREKKSVHERSSRPETHDRSSRRETPESRHERPEPRRVMHERSSRRETPARSNRHETPETRRETPASHRRGKAGHDGARAMRPKEGRKREG
jgi:cyclic pyranopterin phosphate synthase